jgi:hypothetical protein
MSVFKNVMSWSYSQGSGCQKAQNRSNSCFFRQKSAILRLFGVKLAKPGRSESDIIRHEKCPNVLLGQRHKSIQLFTSDED